MQLLMLYYYFAIKKVMKRFTLGATYKIILVDRAERLFIFEGGNPASVRFLDDHTLCPIERLPRYIDIVLVSED